MRILNVILGLGLLLGTSQALADDESTGAKAEGKIEEAHEAVKDETQGAADAQEYGVRAHLTNVCRRAQVLIACMASSTSAV